MVIFNQFTKIYFTINFLTDGDLILDMQQSITDNVKNFDKQIQGLPSFQNLF